LLEESNTLSNKVQAMVKKVLETPFLPDEIVAEKCYFRTHDDCDGNKHEGVSVTITPDGDAWVETRCKSFSSCRYRMPMLGGGNSPRVRNALLLLAVAIKLDNDASKESEVIYGIQEKCKRQGTG
jgi:hypothetical protein